MIFCRSRRRTLRFFRRAVLLAAAAAGTLALAVSCRTPPSPPPTAHGAVMPIDYAVFEWKTENDFKRIPEYFTDKEFTIFDRALRTDAETRDGLYLIVGVENARKIPAGSYATLRYLRPDMPGVQQRQFVFPRAWHSTAFGELRFGLTGDAWPKSFKNKQPTAWRFTLRSPDGILLLYRESFLWTEPFDEKDPETPPPPATPEDAPEGAAGADAENVPADAEPDAAPAEEAAAE